MSRAELADARRKFRDSGLPFPPLPKELASSFRRFDRWHWGTRELDRMSMYFFEPFQSIWAQGVPDDYMAVSHGGHGANSYFLTYHLVYRPIAVMFQTGWGGACGDADLDAIRFQRLCRLTAGLVDVAAGLRQAAKTPSGLAVIQCSEARSVRLFQVIDSSVGGKGTTGSDGSNEPDAPYDWAEQWLRGAGL
jgi:hypothetical protein